MGEVNLRREPQEDGGRVDEDARRGDQEARGKAAEMGKEDACKGASEERPAEGSIE